MTFSMQSFVARFRRREGKNVFDCGAGSDDHGWCGFDRWSTNLTNRSTNLTAMALSTSEVGTGSTLKAVVAVRDFGGGVRKASQATSGPSR